MGTIQHSAIAALDRHPPKAHAMTAHAAAAVSDRGKVVKSDPTTGAIIFSTSSLPTVAGDPVSPSNGDVWYDSSNDRLRVKLAAGLATVAVIFDT